MLFLGKEESYINKERMKERGIKREIGDRNRKREREKDY